MTAARKQWRRRTERFTGTACSVILSVVMLLSSQAFGVLAGQVEAKEVEGSKNTVAKLVEKSDKLADKARIAGEEADRLTAEEEFYEAYDKYKESLKLLRKRDAVLTEASERTNDVRTRQSLLQASEENAQATKRLVELINLLKMSLR